jgi:hypothetical protein
VVTVVPDPPKTADLPTHLAIAALADYVETVVTTGPSTPPLKVFRPGVAGRKAWLAQAEKTLRTDF